MYYSSSATWGCIRDLPPGSNRPIEYEFIYVHLNLIHCGSVNHFLFLIGEML
nr:MAG TPA: hypothetical protein [Caudoviricetes sp.]